MYRDFFINEFYHTYNRGTEKRDIFLEEKDYLRGVHDLYEFNDANAVVNFNRRINRSPTSINSGSGIFAEKKPRKILVNLITWALMPNHYHLFSSPKVKDGLSKFHQKFGTGYANYFNLKYERNGTLFQGKYKDVHVINDNQATHLICYIHSNLLDLWKPNWKEKGLTELELQNALKFLEEKKNRWSSHQDYLGIQNFPSLINTDFLFKFFGEPAGYRKFFTDWLKQYEKNINFLQKLTIDLNLK